MNIKKLLCFGLAAAVVSANIPTVTVQAQEVQTEEYQEQAIAVEADVRADAQGFQIENGVLVKYTGTSKDVVIPNSVTSIGDFAFSGCSSLASITIPESVTSIGGVYTGAGAFEGCINLEKFEVNTKNEKYSSENGILYSKDKTTLVCCPASKSGVITIPDSVTSIGERAFMGCSSLASITIPESVTSIGEYAFWGCSSLTSITIPKSVTSIEEGAFSGCSGLASITIPESVTSIEEGAFSGCSGLVNIILLESHQFPA